MFISILGRQPAISAAELEALFGADKLKHLSESALLVEAHTPDIARLGGSIKIIGEVREIKTHKLSGALDASLDLLAKHMTSVEGKVSVGLSVYDDKFADAKTLQHFLIQTKKRYRDDGHSVRVIPNKKPVLNSAQVLHNKLTSGRNIEIVLIKTTSGYWLGKTTGVQDIEALARRDQGRPKRDTRVGMLPPKLALMMLNLSGLQQQSGAPKTVLDPFCGTGVVLQEALLLGHYVYGTDLERRMIDYTKDNLQWLVNDYIGGLSPVSQPPSIRLEQGDATKFEWDGPIDAVVCETFLGPPLNSPPTHSELSKIINDVDYTLKSFLKNIHSQLLQDVKLCVAVPAWHVKGEIKHLPMVDDLENLGYTRRVLKHVSHEELIYYRPNQIVAREILILQKN